MGPMTRFESNSKLGSLASLLISGSWSGRNGVGRRVKKYYHVVGSFPDKISL